MTSRIRSYVTAPLDRMTAVIRDEIRVRIWDDDDVIYDRGDVRIGGGPVIVKS